MDPRDENGEEPPVIIGRDDEKRLILY